MKKQLKNVLIWNEEEQCPLLVIPSEAIYVDIRGISTNLSYDDESCDTIHTFEYMEISLVKSKLDSQTLDEVLKPELYVCKIALEFKNSPMEIYQLPECGYEYYTNVDNFLDEIVILVWRDEQHD